MKNIIIIGSRGYNYNYGGWEALVSNLINNYKDEDVRFFVPELSYKLNSEIEIRNGVICKQVFIPKHGLLTMFSFVLKSLLYYTRLIKKNRMKNTIIYMLGVRGGIPLMFLNKKLKKMGVKIITNPGYVKSKYESKPWIVKKFIKLSEKEIIKSSDLILCDSKLVENYIKDNYKIKTKYIPFGVSLDDFKDLDKKTRIFMDKKNIRKREYYLVVGRFIPKNNIELIIKEFMLSDTNKDLVIVSDVSKNKFYNKLLETTSFNRDRRIKFVGPIYDKDIITRLRINSKGFIYGHKEGGLNPSLIESLAVSDINIVYDNDYNREVGKDSCIYFNKDAFNLRDIIERVDRFKTKEYLEYGNKAKDRVKEEYELNTIINKYKKLFNNLLK